VIQVIGIYGVFFGGLWPRVLRSQSTFYRGMKALNRDGDL